MNDCLFKFNNRIPSPVNAITTFSFSEQSTNYDKICNFFIYFILAGWKKCLRGGAVGFSLATIYTLITSRDRVKQMIGMD